jgi:UDP-N-acetylglucosamine 1-carboxyvinyltransferase
MGVRFEQSARYKADNQQTDLVDIKMLKTDELVALDEKIHPQPYPGLNIDNLPFFVPVAARAKGKTLIHDWVYENRAIYFTELTKLGVEMELLDPHRIHVFGPTKWRRADIVCPPALRPAVIVLIGMLAADGVSTLRNIYSITRGYEDLAERLNALGAKIEILRDI